MNWNHNFDERQLRLIRNCRDYASSDPAGMPGHNLALVVAKFAFMMDAMESLIEDVAKAPHSNAMVEMIEQRWRETKRIQL